MPCKGSFFDKLCRYPISQGVSLNVCSHVTLIVFLDGVAPGLRVPPSCIFGRATSTMYSVTGSILSNVYLCANSVIFFTNPDQPADHTISPDANTCRQKHDIMLTCPWTNIRSGRAKQVGGVTEHPHSPYGFGQTIRFRAPGGRIQIQISGKHW